MRELHGLFADSNRYHNQLKSRALLFDKFYVPGLGVDLKILGKMVDKIPRLNQVLADFEYLRSRDILNDVPGLMYFDAIRATREMSPEFAKYEARIPRENKEASARFMPTKLTAEARVVAGMLSTASGARVIPLDVVPLAPEFGTFGDNTVIGNVIQVTFEKVPVPDQDCDWEAILDFKAHALDKQWALRRFLQTLASKGQTAAEIRDDIEWSMNEYAKEMDRAKIKRSVSFVETYLIPFVEAFESLKPSSFLKGYVSLKKRKLELLDIEAKAAGRECAYLFDARSRFDNSGRVDGKT